MTARKEGPDVYLPSGQKGRASLTGNWRATIRAVMVAAAAGTVTSAMVVAEDWSTTTRVTVVAAVAVTGGAVTVRTGPGVTRSHRGPCARPPYPR